MKKNTVKSYFGGLAHNTWLYLLIIVSLLLKIQFSRMSFQIPELAAIFIFYKIIHNDDNLNIYFLVIFSVFQDIFQDLPLGTMLLSYFVFIHLLEANRRYIFDHGEVICLVGFGLSFASMLVIKAMIFVATYGISQISPEYYFMELLYMIGYYPLIHTAINKVLRTYPNE